MTSPLHSPDQLRHDVWAQIETLDARLAEATDPAVRKSLEANRDHFRSLLAAAPSSTLALVNAANPVADMSEREMTDMWSQILGEAEPAIGALPVL